MSEALFDNAMILRLPTMSDTTDIKMVKLEGDIRTIAKSVIQNRPTVFHKVYYSVHEDRVVYFYRLIFVDGMIMSFCTGFVLLHFLLWLAHFTV